MNDKTITLLASDRGTWDPEPEPLFDDPSVRIFRWRGTVHNALTALDLISPLSGVIVPMYEDDVLPVAVATETYGVRGLSWPSASCTVDRYLLRRTLDGDLNPQYGPHPQWNYGSPRQICKARASCGGSGVVVFDDLEDAEVAAGRAILGAHWEVANLRTAHACFGQASLPFPEVEAVYERYIGGTQYEVSGVVAEPGDMEIWRPLEQRWSHGKIVEYKRVTEGVVALKETAARAVAALGLSWCGFCVEVRQGLVIEVNARLGDDGLGYDALLRGGHPTRYHRMVSFMRSRL